MTRGLDAVGRDEVMATADEIVVPASPSSGLWAYAEALKAFGDRADRFDELVLTSDEWFGPLTPLSSVISRMDSRFVDIWSITDHRDVRSGDKTEGRDGVIRLSTYWLAARRRVRDSRAWKAFWSGLPACPEFGWEVRRVEDSLSEQLLDAGFRVAAAFPSDDYPAEHADTFNVDLLIENGCPAVPRAVFDGYPLFYDQHAISGRRLAEAMSSRGYPIHLLWSDLAQTVSPKRLHTNGSMLEVLPSKEKAGRRADLRVLGIIHVLETDPLAEVMERIASVPGLARLVVTIGARASTELVERAWERTVGQRVPLEIRDASRRTTPDTLVVFDECRDLLLDGDYELVVALHTGVPAHLSRNAREYFRRQQIECLMGKAEGYVANVVDLFADDPSVGLVFPPTPHVGMSTLGDGWLGQREAAMATLARLKVDVPVDWASPHAPFGGMWVGRPEAVGALASISWSTDVHAGQNAMRLLSSVAGQNGFVSRTVATSEHAGLSHGSLEYIADHMATTSYGYPAGYTSFLHRAGPVGSGRGIDFLRMWLRFRHPRVGKVIAGAAVVMRGARKISGGFTAGVRKGL
ncbi:rhamnan synthesis F family protein [Microbacterium proteolyticum]|uniref:rhamnan synthesis F family protein n=1 Tax=Microbacterium proteolyticum TaxID=1572644 RepID=UPI001FAD6094|nr:rhamnan synthesis F family protein [Microbacterium proteolyticum]MCI9857697.1 hypothetical protein [Microbacterium proteolyticum]